MNIQGLGLANQDTSFDPPMSFTTVRPDHLSIIASDFDARPMSFLKDGERMGYEPAVTKAVCELLGLKPMWFNLPMQDFYTALSTGQYDVIWFKQAITQDRRAWADFTRPYGRFDEAILVRDESPIHEPKDLAGKRLGGLDGGTSLDLAQYLPELELMPFPGNNRVLPDMLQALKDKKIDAIIDDALVLMAAEANDPTFRVAFPMPTRLPFGVGVLPGNRELLEALNRAITSLIADGSLNKLWGRWIPYVPYPF
ncbi:Bacterial ionotropic glutamate receptor [Halomicronema hongdechloris C2206]|uniref:Bacterial ionotropic glutamate receptor n=1 Tax=Halomicronema hongdechloris C2206 TaxID=1641165 RepID=A0A1Z3HUK2_9CYAN|nr:ABC transporter substrate-binding protein [Halomicronema hongdechloris]ASC73942.1 Bacterial ionotropic glutamate receptor [Halomicronema hongdechloris C2206]